MKKMERELAKVEENFTLPELAKVLLATDKNNGYGSLGQADGAQGALSQPE
jgi:hypothetical protein